MLSNKISVQLAAACLLNLAQRSIATFLVWFGFVLILSVSFFLNSSLAFASDANEINSEPIILNVFVREGCPHCADAKVYLQILSQQRPDVTIVIRSLDDDKTAQSDLIKHSKEAGIWPPGVPTFEYNNNILVGFESTQRSGPKIIALLEQNKTTGIVETTLFGTINVAEIGLPTFTLALGLLDGFNPCAMWVLLFLLSLLVRLQNRRRMAIIAGTFVLVSGVVYYAFMAVWLNVFLLLGFSFTLRLILGCSAILIGTVNIKDFFSDKSGFSLSIPDKKKPDIYARLRRILATEKLLPSLAGVAILAVVVNFAELLCTAGLPAIYTAVLTQQDIAPRLYYSYLLLYILAYIADDALMVTIAVIALSNRRLTESAGRWLKLLSGTVMLLLGGIFLLRPEWLI